MDAFARPSLVVVSGVPLRVSRGWLAIAAILTVVTVDTLRPADNDRNRSRDDLRQDNEGGLKEEHAGEKDRDEQDGEQRDRNPFFAPEGELRERQVTEQRRQQRRREVQHADENQEAGKHPIRDGSWAGKRAWIHQREAGASCYR